MAENSNENPELAPAPIKPESVPLAGPDDETLYARAVKSTNEDLTRGYGYAEVVIAHRRIAIRLVVDYRSAGWRVAIGMRSGERGDAYVLTICHPKMDLDDSLSEA